MSGVLWQDFGVLGTKESKAKFPCAAIVSLFDNYDDAGFINSDSKHKPV